MSKKGITAVTFCVIAAAALSLLMFFKGHGAKEELAENQQTVYAYVVSIEGNEMTYMEVEEHMITAMQDSTEADQENESRRPSERGFENETGEDKPSGNPTKGFEGEAGEQTPGEGMPSGDPPEGLGEEKNLGSPPEGLGEESSEQEAEETLPSREMQEGENMRRNETVTVLIPVGTAVYTDADTTVTFSRLAAGDTIKLLLETDEAGTEIITGIWILQ